jgi:hypothetical protein
VDGLPWLCSCDQSGSNAVIDSNGNTLTKTVGSNTSSYAGMGVELAIEVLDGSPDPPRGSDSAATKNKNIGIGCVTVLIAIFLVGLLIHFL